MMPTTAPPPGAQRGRLRTIGDAERAAMAPELLDVIEYRKSGLSLNWIVGCPLDCAYCAEIADLVAEHDLRPVWVMPEGTTVAAVLAGTAALLGPATERGWNLSTRLHVLAGAR